MGCSAWVVCSPLGPWVCRLGSMVPRFAATSCGFCFDLFCCFSSCRGFFFFFVFRGEKGCCGFFSKGEEEEEEETEAFWFSFMELKCSKLNF